MIRMLHLLLMLHPHPLTIRTPLSPFHNILPRHSTKCIHLLLNQTKPLSLPFSVSSSIANPDLCLALFLLQAQA
jgi:hypothetical protein